MSAKSVSDPRSVASTAKDDSVGTALSPALTVAETSALLRLDPRTVRAMLKAGELEGNQRGHAIRVSRASVLEWLSGKRRAPRSKR